MKTVWILPVVSFLFWTFEVTEAPAANLHPENLRLLPYPQEIELSPGDLSMGPPKLVTHGPVSATKRIALESLAGYLPRQGKALPVRLGSVEEGYQAGWLSPKDRGFLTDPKTSPDASVLTISPDGITAVGKGKWGMLYAVQTVNQLIRGTQTVQDLWQMKTCLPCLKIRDWPDLKWRCLSPQMTWYSGYNRLEGYDNGNWTLDEWKWLVDWSLLHKCNAWALCMYGNWPFTLPGYEETTLDVNSYFFNPQTGKKEPHRFTHRNIKKEFLPELIRYANQRGIKIHAYIGKNTFNGTYGLKHPQANAGGAAELIPFHPGVHAYWEAFLRRIIDIGFNGFVFEDPEALHVPNQNEMCYKTFWEPWAKTYGFKSMAQTDQNNPPLGVHVEYYSWLFRVFDEMIQKHAAKGGRDLEIYLISHILLSRMVSESKTQQERDRWFAYIDAKQGRKVPFIILEADEDKYVSFLGSDRVASLGGRGGSCTNAMRRIASINNNWCGGSMGGDLAYERRCQKHIYQAGGFGAMGYIFEWTNTEVFGYLAAQYLWRNAGVPGLNNDNQTDFLQYCYRLHYGDQVGTLAAQVLDDSSCVNEAMMLEGVYGSQYPSTGAPLDRDYQYLAAQADRAVILADRAFQLYTGHKPDLFQPVYRQEDFRWNGFNSQSNQVFNAERLRLLYVSTRRSQKMCEAVLAHRLAQRLLAEGAPAQQVLQQYDRALDAARANQLIYQLNYDDDYDWTDGLCARVTEALESQRGQFRASIGTGLKPVQAWTFDRPGDLQGWTEVHDLARPVVTEGALACQATGSDPFVVQSKLLSVPVNKRCFVEVEMTSDKPGRLRVFWATQQDLAAQPPGAYPFSEGRVRNADVVAGSEFRLYRVSPDWDGTLARLRIDVPRNAKVRIGGIRILRIPEENTLTPASLARRVPDSLRRSAGMPLFIPWEKQTDLLPENSRATRPGYYLSLDLGCDTKEDFYRLGVVFTVEGQEKEGKWRTLFRRGVGRRTTGWEHWDIPLADWEPGQNRWKLRLMTDSYSRAQDRSAPSWKWALWGQPQVVEIMPDGSRRTKYDFIQNLGPGRALVRLDQNGKERAFDGKGVDSTGATFKKADLGIIHKLRAGEGKEWQWVEGFAGWAKPPPQKSSYRCYLGSVESGWVYAHQKGEVSWLTAHVPEKRFTAVTFIGGTGYGPGKAELWCDGQKLLEFETSKPKNCSWEDGGVELRYLHGGNTRSPTIPFGISGVYLLRLPASWITPRKPLNLAVKVPAQGGGDWFMVHEYRDVTAVTADASLPPPSRPAIVALTPHLEGKFGVTIAEYLVLQKGGSTPDLNSGGP